MDESIFIPTIQSDRTVWGKLSIKSPYTIIESFQK